VKILLNRANTNVGIERDDVLAILGRDVDILLPSHRDIARSINQGVPIALQGSSEAKTAFHNLAKQYIDASLATTADAPAIEAEVAGPHPARRPLFRRAARTA
jgi:septum formation inhibitor-activating ATPase MinD